MRPHRAWFGLDQGRHASGSAARTNSADWGSLVHRRLFMVNREKGPGDGGGSPGGEAAVVGYLQIGVSGTMPAGFRRPHVPTAMVPASPDTLSV
jgi:hypothetical protein